MQFIARLFVLTLAALATILAIEMNSAILAGAAVFSFGCFLSILTDNIRETIYKTR